MDELRSGILAVLTNEISLIFVLIIISIFTVAVTLGLVYRFASKSVSLRFRRFIAYAPTAMTTIGVMGTFVGVFVGLQAFDVENIDASVPPLLNGLKIAFGTSIAGMVFTVFFRAVEHSGRMVFGSRPHHDSGQNPSELLSLIDKSIKTQTSWLVSGHENSLLTTLKLTRDENRQASEKQLKLLKEFTEQMQEGATKAIIEALKNVIEDFNAKITEQFGDNFKELNSAVGNLNDWQQEYKFQIETTQKQLLTQSNEIEKITNHLTTVADNISNLSEQAKSLPIAADKMSEANNAILENFASMNELLQSLSEIKTNAQSLLPEIESSVQKMIKTLQNTSEEMRSELKESLERTHQGIDANFKSFDQQMEAELQKILQEFGSNLTSLSEKFVEDYTPITDKIRLLIQELGRAA